MITAQLSSKMEKAIQYNWEHSFHLIQPGYCYTLTPKRKQMISARLREIETQGLSREDAVNTRILALEAFTEDDYFMGRKKGYEGAGRKGI